MCYRLLLVCAFAVPGSYVIAMDRDGSGIDSGGSSMSISGSSLTIGSRAVSFRANARSRSKVFGESYMLPTDKVDAENVFPLLEGSIVQSGCIARISEERVIQERVFRMAQSPNGRYLAVVMNNPCGNLWESRIRIIDRKDRENKPKEFQLVLGVDTVEWDNSTLKISTFNVTNSRTVEQDEIFWASPHKNYFFDMEAGTFYGVQMEAVDFVIKHPNGGAWSIVPTYAEHKNQNFMAEVQSDGVINLRDTMRGRTYTLHDPRHPAHTIAFGDNGKKLFCGAQNGRVYFWDLSLYVALREWQARYKFGFTNTEMTFWLPDGTSFRRPLEPEMAYALIAKLQGALRERKRVKLNQEERKYWDYMPQPLQRALGRAIEKERHTDPIPRRARVRRRSLSMRLFGK